VVEGLDPATVYKAQITVKNAMGWSERSPDSRPLKLADHRPECPGAPILKPLSDDSLEFTYAAPPGSTHVTVWLNDTAVDGNTHKLIEKGAAGPGVAHVVTAGPTVTVKGLKPATSYVGKISALNKFGWSSHSTSSRPVQLPDAEAPVVTGSTTWEERDKELRKRAVDVEQEGEGGWTSFAGVKRESKLPKTPNAPKKSKK